MQRRDLTGGLRELIRKPAAIALCALLVIACCFYLMPEPVHLRLGIFAGSNWNVPDSMTYRIVDQVIAKYRENYPNVAVEYDSGIVRSDYTQWLASEILKGQAPDVFMILDEDFLELASLGALMPLERFTENDVTYNASSFIPAALESGQYQGVQYAIPREVNPQFLFVNRTLLKNEGIELPEEGLTLRQLREICQSLLKDTNGDGLIDQAGIYNFTWKDAASAYGINVSDPQAILLSLQDGTMVTIVELLQDLQPKGMYTSSEDFDEGRVAFAPMSYAEYRTYKPYPWRVKKYSRFEWDCIPMPASNGEIAGSVLPVLLMGISSKTRYPMDAWRLLQTFTSDLQIWDDHASGMPGLPSLRLKEQENLSLEEEGLDMEMVQNVLNASRPVSGDPKAEEVKDLVDSAIARILHESSDIEYDLLDLENQIRVVLQK